MSFSSAMGNSGKFETVTASNVTSENIITTQQLTINKCIVSVNPEEAVDQSFIGYFYPNQLGSDIVLTSGINTEVFDIVIEVVGTFLIQVVFNLSIPSNTSTAPFLAQFTLYDTSTNTISTMPELLQSLPSNNTEYLNINIPYNNIFYAPVNTCALVIQVSMLFKGPSPVELSNAFSYCNLIRLA
jgi:hypothetical protein